MVQLRSPYPQWAARAPLGSYPRPFFETGNEPRGHEGPKLSTRENAAILKEVFPSIPNSKQNNF